MRALQVGLAGLGTVGGGVVRLLAAHADVIAERAGRAIRVAAVAARDRAKQRDLPLNDVRWVDDARALATDTSIDVVVEVIGGADGVARELTEAALKAKKPVVTANKAMLALHGTALARAAEAAGVPIACEAAVAGGIPIVKALREGLAANRIERVFGILNGTCNYILTQMQESGRGFAEVLAEAQKLGYAEADPSFDVDGIDAAHKLAVLAGIAFNRPVDFGAVHIEGIRAVDAIDIDYARELGYRIKLLAIARRTRDGIEQRVHPCMVDAEQAIAHVDGVFNAVVAEGDFVDRTMYVGRGAGAGPTASAVVADLIDVARGKVPPLYGVAAAHLADIPAAPMERHVGEYYVRLTVADRPGVIADVSAVLRDERISIESLLQRARAVSDEAVPVVMVTHETEEAAMRRALAKIGALASVTAPPCMIRIEQL
ncbi:homoserine dehydrogenase [Desertibaculum subflavum]|uniref:homoserine dehydrogenase n=1 Tax=Desertibaculum subflavum TaxID=2268458 RepID=UPI000E671BD5